MAYCGTCDKGRCAALRTLERPAETQGSLDDPWTLLDHVPEVWGYAVGQGLHDDDGTACAMPASRVNGAWIRQVIPDADTNRSCWPTDHSGMESGQSLAIGVDVRVALLYGKGAGFPLG